jgi:NAD(P)-dependent dehydrogenase (short-subunit alcohol dehydrogenase family)
MSANVVVTGAAGGMGSATVRLLAERGANVLAVDRDSSMLDGLMEEMKGRFPGVVAHTADVGDADEVSSLFDEVVERWGGLDGLFNIAAILGEFKLIAESSDEGFDEVLRVNLKSAWYTMRCALPHLVRRGGGAIVNTGSYLAWHGCELLGPYNVSKHALVGLTKTAAVEYGRYNIRVNILCPGSIETRMHLDTAAGFSPEDPEAGRRELERNAATGRTARPEEIAAVGVFLLLDAPVQLTGALIPVDGGYSAK